MKITKRFSWVMGHRLTTHEGGCYNPHGHNYEAKVSIEGPVDSQGMVMDFGDLGKICKQIFDVELDHAFMVWDKDRFKDSLKSWTGEHPRPFKIVEVPFETTAENMAIWLFDRINAEVKAITHGMCKVNRVKVYETPKNEAAHYG